LIFFILSSEGERVKKMLKEKFCTTLKVLGFALALVATNGCATIVSQSVSDMAKGPGKKLTVADKGNGYVMLTLPKLDGLSMLKLQCPGSLTGVSNTLSMHNWLFIVQEYSQEVSGWCQNP